MKPIPGLTTKVKEDDPNDRIVQPVTTIDEAIQLIGRLEATIARLKHKIQIHQDHERMLVYHQEHLEQIIIERSQALESEVIARKRVEERLKEMERLELLGPVVGGAVHDLNNILAGIVTYPDLLLLKLSNDSPLVKPLQSIRRSGVKAAAITQDLLALTRHRLESKETVNLHAVVEEYLRSQEYRQLQTRFPDIKVTCTFLDGRHPFLGSPEYLARIVMHLISNAAATMPDGGTIRIISGHRDLDAPLQAYEPIPEGRYAVLEVEDQGSGMGREELARIFEPFYTNKKLGLGGTGLGMTIVREMVKDLNGFIDCTSQIGQGSRFTLFFPLAPGPDQA